MRLKLGKPFLPLLAVLSCLGVAASAQTIQVTVAPSSVTLSNSQVQQFVATVTGAPDQQVVWAVAPNVGSLDQSGVYTAPASIATQQTVTITASSMFDINAKANATVTLVPPSVSLVISPRTNLSARAGGQIQFSAAVAGASNKNVTWSVSGVNNGSILPTGPTANPVAYTAPSSIPTQRTVTVRAVSQADPTVSDSVSITLLPTVNTVSITNTCGTTTLTNGQQCQFTAAVSPTGIDQTVTWSVFPGVGSIAGGLYTAPSNITVTQTVTITATSVADSTKSASANLTLSPPTATVVTISPSAVTLSNGQTQQFFATVTGAATTDVTWTISPTSLGSISSTGFYTAPTNLVSPSTVTVTARSVYDPTKTGTAVVTLVPVVAVSLKPATATASANDTVLYTATVTGSTNADVTWSVSPNVGTLTPTGTGTATYAAPSSITTVQSLVVTATSVADPTKSASAALTLQPGPIVVTVSPASVTLNNSQTQQFVATVTGAPITDVSWSISPSSLGSINSAGVYTAPGNLVAPATVTVTARSLYDTSKTATATVNLVPVFVTVAVSPVSVSLTPGQTQQFSATVSGTPVPEVTWSLSPSSGAGSISSTGLYTAPANVINTQTVTVIARSVGDPSKSGTATVTLLPMVGVTVKPAFVNAQAAESVSFTATVVGTNSTEVTWSLSPNEGTLTVTGPGAVTYTAPDSIGANHTVLLVATSVADPTKSGVANINLVRSSQVTLALTPKTVTLNANQTQQFTLTVTGTTVTDVVWTISPANAGTMTQTGLYTAPAKVTATQTVTVTVYSTLDGSRTATATITLSPVTTAIDVGTGAPSEAVRQLFVQAFFRGGFNNGVTLPPSAMVARYGSTGWFQTFRDATTSSVTHALVKPDSSVVLANGTPATVWQVWSDVWSYYNSIGSGTAGYPTADTQWCPFFDISNACSYQFFDRNYVIFSYRTTLGTGKSFYVRNLFYTKWNLLGGLNGLGRPVDGEVAVTSSRGGNATMQTYAAGAIYSMTSGALAGQIYAVAEPIYSRYMANNGHLGSLGFPTSEAITLSSGSRRQQFQGGAIDSVPGSEPTYRPPVAFVVIQAPGGNQVRMNLGDTVQVTAATAGPTGSALAGRPISWASSNGRVVQVVGSGATVTLKATGGGNATVTAASEGKVSTPLEVMVTAPCCQLGEGAPTTAIQQAFRDAAVRNRLDFVLPSDNSVQRVGNGYVQSLEALGTGARYLLAKADSSTVVYYLTGELLARYVELGGPAGALGYPLADPTPGGRQVFENNAALAGSPVRLVSGAVLKKWAVLGYETGAAGLPTGDAGPVLTFTATSGLAQAFAGGAIYAVTSGMRSGQAFFVGPPILDRYLALGGPTGAYGLPASDEFAAGDTRRQNFEGGYIEYASGETEAHEHAAARQPTVLATPGATLAGSRVRVSAYGFDDGATIRISVAGRNDFQVTARNGAYSWETFIPTGAAPGVVRVRAVDTKTNAAAEGSYEVKSYLDAGVRLVKVQGDNQTGVPGARLAQALRVALKDQAGNPIAGAAVNFQASPGAVVSPAAAVTDANGEAQTWLRLPPSDGLAAATAEAPTAALQPVTFNARSVAFTLVNFPRLTQTSTAALGKGPETIAQNGALLTAVATILQYHQNRGELPSERGLADAVSLNQFLKGLRDGFLSNPDSGPQVVNLWRVGEFVSNAADVAVESFERDAVRDLLAQGSPVLLSLALTAGGAPAGGHFVVAIGVAEDGSLVIHDPHPQLARTNLSEYETGFAAGGSQWKGELRGAVRLALRSPAARRFLVAAVSLPASLLENMALAARSVAGPCGAVLELGDPAPAGGVSRLLSCDGAQPFYQVDVGAAQRFRASLTDLAGGAVSDLSGSAPASWRVSRAGAGLVVTPQDLVLAPGAVVNGATFTPGVAPGGLMAVFGAGLAAPSGKTEVQIGGMDATVVSASTFQVNAQVPPELAPGAYTLTVRSPFGVAEQPVEIRKVAPMIFEVSPGRGALVNPDGKLNSPSTAARRGQTLLIYATGLGAVARQGNLSPVTEPVKVVLNGQELTASFAGLAPGLTGTYQVNVVLPGGAVPGLDLPLLLRQGSADSNSVPVAVDW